MARENSGPSKRELRTDESAQLFARRLAKEVKEAFEESTTLPGEEASESIAPSKESGLSAHSSTSDAEGQVMSAPVGPSTEPVRVRN